MSPLLPVAVPSRLSRFDVGVDPKDVAAKEVVFAAEKNIPISYLRNIEYGY